MRLRAGTSIGPPALVLASFAGSRVIYALLGVRFDSSPLNTYWQYIDPQLLREDLLQSLWHLHTQPPLFNAYLGGVLKAADNHYVAAFHASYVAIGLLFAGALYLLMRRLGASAWISAGLTSVFIASPPVVLFENWLYVDYAVAALLTVAALFLHRFATAHRPSDALGFSAACATIVLARPVFPVFWLLLLLAIVLALQWDHRRALAVGSVIPVLLCAGFYAKNYVMFGNTSSTSCAGTNLYRVLTKRLDREELKRLVQQGELSELALLPPYSLPVTKPELFRGHEPTGVPQLDRPRKSTGGANVGHEEYRQICREYQDDAVAVLRRHPGLLAKGIGEGLLIYFRPSADYEYFTQANRSSVRHPDRVFDLVVMGQARSAPGGDPVENPPGFSEVGWFLIGAYLLGAALGARFLWRARRHGDLSSANAGTVAFILFTVLWVTAVGNVLEVGENNRFRFTVDGLMLALLVFLAGGWIHHRGRSQRLD